MKAATFTKKEYETARKQGRYLVHITIRDPGKTTPGSRTTIHGAVNDAVSDVVWKAIKVFCEGD